MESWFHIKWKIPTVLCLTQVNRSQCGKELRWELCVGPAWLTGVRGPSPQPDRSGFESETTLVRRQGDFFKGQYHCALCPSRPCAEMPSESPGVRGLGSMSAWVFLTAEKLRGPGKQDQRACAPNFQGSRWSACTFHRGGRAGVGSFPSWMTGFPGRAEGPWAQKRGECRKARGWGRGQCELRE